MKLSEFKHQLKTQTSLHFVLPDGSSVPPNFHITEVGSISKDFIDCGGTIRNEKTICFQLWDTTDYDHRLHPEKLLSIIELSENKLGLTDEEIEVEYQGETIGKYGLEVKDNYFLLSSLSTNCLAKEKCGVKEQKPKISLSSLSNKQDGCCAPNSACC